MKAISISVVAAALLMGCLTSKEKSSAEVIGYSSGIVCAPCSNVTQDTIRGVQLYTDTLKSDSFFVYLSTTDTIKRPDFFKSHLYLTLVSPTNKPIYDDGGQCLNIPQSGKITVIVDGKEKVVQVPIVSCMPYLLEKDVK